MKFELVEEKGLTFTQGLFLLLVGLKITNQIDWSWAVICTPIFVGFVWDLIAQIVRQVVNNKK